MSDLSEPNYKLVHCTLDLHGRQILDIFNDAILTSTALYEYEPRTMATMEAWFHAKSGGGYPVLGLENNTGELLGFVSYGAFRPQPAYKYTVEHSVYVRSDHRGQGLGQTLLIAIIDAATADQRHSLMGVIDNQNLASIALHEKNGFTRVGTLPQVGYKFGRWLDAAIYQLVLSGPDNPTDG